MSATINQNKIKFAIWGNGFDDVRNDSGDGTIRNILYYFADYACIDVTGRYLWMAGSESGYSGLRIVKYDLKTFERIEQTAIPTNYVTVLLHPSNINNNLGIAIQQGGNAYVFDLTTGEVINSGPKNYDLPGNAYDCFLLNDTDLRIVSCRGGDVTNYTYTLDLDTLEMTKTTIVVYCSSSGFVDGNSIFATYRPEWFSDRRHIYGILMSGGVTWDVIASEAGSAGFPNISLYGWGKGGYIYLPCKINNKWKVGKFAWSGSTDFETPTPISTFGEFPQFPNLNPRNGNWHVAHNDTRDKCVITTDLGLYYCDYTKLKLIDDNVVVALALRNNVIIGKIINTNTIIIHKI